MVRQGKTAGKLARRSILTQKKRYFAILLIVLLSVGFLSGLKVTKEQMWDAAGRYLAAENMYDYRIYSTLGFSEDDIKELGKVSGIYDAEGEKTADVIFDFAGTGKDYQVLSLPERINIPSLYAGRLPEKDTECLADHRAFSESDIGKTITVSADNDADTRDLLANEKYTIVGLVNSPLFLSSDRGSASGGTGERGGYLYLPADNFTSDYYTGADLVLNPDSAEKAPDGIFGEEYEDLVEKCQDKVEKEAKALYQIRYESILSMIKEAAAAAAQGASPQASVSGLAVSEEAAGKESAASAEEMAASEDVGSAVEEPKVYVLTRDENAGYRSFENDTSIIHSIANIFPLFFIVIALLVCVTTMLRMVEEERGQIGTLKGSRLLGNCYYGQVPAVCVERCNSRMGGRLFRRDLFPATGILGGVFHTLRLYRAPVYI